MLAKRARQRFNLRMTGESNPSSLKEFIEQLPSKCRDCSYAKLVVMLEFAEAGTQGPSQRVIDIGDRCTGYEGPDLQSEYYDEIADRSGCPYIFLVRAENES